jgi:hypothetical protein
MAGDVRRDGAERVALIGLGVTGTSPVRSPILGLVLGVMLSCGLFALVPQAGAADATVRRSTQDGGEMRTLPYPRSERAQAIWDERACWSECGAHTAWGMAACLERDNQGRCLRLTDQADRYRQRACRTSGGPFVPDIFDF